MNQTERNTMISALTLSKHNIDKAISMLYESDSENESKISEKIDSLILKDENHSQIIDSLETLTINDIKYIINNKLVSNLLLGKKVIIPNDKSETNEWLIIGVNHDITNNTIDLRSNIAAITDKVFDNNSNIYESSYIRKLLNEEFLNGFSNDIKSMMQYMNVSSNGKTLSDKVKLLSMSELGLEDYSSDIVKGEGIPYPYITHMIKDKDGEYRTHMTRSRYTSDSGDIWQVGCVVGVYCNCCGCDRAAAPVIRLG